MKKAYARSLNNLAVDAMVMQPLKPPGMTKPTIDPEAFHPGMSHGGSSKNLYHEVWRKIASSMMDVSLFLSNANQLANVIRKPNFETSWEVFEIISLALICASIALQILVGVVMIMTKRKTNPDASSDESNRFISICVFLIFVMNVMILCINNEPSHYRCPQVGCIAYNATTTWEPRYNVTATP